MTDHLSVETDVPELSAELSAYLGSAMAPAVEHTTAAIPMRDMHPLVADALKIDTTKSFRPDEVTNLLAGRRTDGKAINRPPEGNARIAYTDFTFSAPKSFSLAWSWHRHLPSGPSWKSAGFGRTMRWSSTSEARSAMCASARRAPRAATWPSSNHYTNRPTVKVPRGPNDTELIAVPTHVPGDMQRHTHNFFLHVAVTDDGKVRAPILDETRDRIQEWGAIGHA